MNNQIFDAIREALANADESSWTQELHIQVIKYADSLADVTGKEFCEAVQIKDSYFAEFNKMKKIATRLSLLFSYYISSFNDIMNFKFYPQLVKENPLFFKQGVFQQTVDII